MCRLENSRPTRDVLGVPVLSDAEVDEGTQQVVDLHTHESYEPLEGSHVPLTDAFPAPGTNIFHVVNCYVVNCYVL